MITNYWINRRYKRFATDAINAMLSKFIGRKIKPIDDLFSAMRKIVIKYFKANPDQIKYFTINNEPFDYDFEIEEEDGVVTDVEFQAE